MATQGYQEYAQGGYHSMPNHLPPPHGSYEHWNHPHNSLPPPPNVHIPYHVSSHQREIKTLYQSKGSILRVVIVEDFSTNIYGSL